jgi:Flp pilus assembly protein TadG
MLRLGREEGPVVKRRSTTRRTAARRRRCRDDGAAAVEFAFVALPLALLLFGMIEFGWVFFQMSDVRHGAREGLRLAAVNADPVPDDGSPIDRGERIAQETCERMDDAAGAIVSISTADADADAVVEIGDEVTVTITRDYEQLTNMFDFALSGFAFDEAVTSRLEQDPDATLDGTVWTCV